MLNKRTMRAAVVEKFGEPLVVREVPIPIPGPGQALVEIVASGVCHTDLHAADGDLAHPAQLRRLRRGMRELESSLRLAQGLRI